MQTFLPYGGFRDSAKSLDRQRLGKQRVENLQIMQRLTGLRLVAGELPEDEWYTEPLEPGGWDNHPAVKMWRGHEGQLFAYQACICIEWEARGYKDTCLRKTTVLYTTWFAANRDRIKLTPAPWLGDPDFHLSHRSNLLRKLPEHYGPLFEDGLSPDLEYVWPTS